MNLDKYTLPKVKLNTGAYMPVIGLGCWSGLTDEEHDSGIVWFKSALEAGYRHFDTAHGYGTEHVVGKAIRESGIPREEIFVTTKLPPHHHAKVAESLQESLDRAGFDYFDLYLMHWPQAFPNQDENPDPRYPSKSGEPGKGQYIAIEKPLFNETWAAMEKLLESGKVKAIGISNFSIKNLTQLLTTAKIIPAVNQVEMHPHLTQVPLLEFTKEKGIILTAYSPTGYSKVATDPTVVKLAEKYGVAPAQISVAFHVARGTTAVPKSTKIENQLSNLKKLPALTEEEVALLGSLNKNIHYCQYPGPDDEERLVFGWTYEQMGW